jgi:membrane protein
MWDEIKQRARLTYEIFVHAGKSYGAHRVGRMAAAVAYRAIFALAPLLLVAIYIVGLVVGSNEEAMTEILAAIDRIAGPTVVGAIETLLLDLSSTSTVTGIVGFVLLLWTASSLFLELQNDLNDIFGVPYEKTRGIFETVRKRGLGFLWALALGLIVVAVLLLNSIWQFLASLFPLEFASVHQVVTIVTPFLSLLVLPIVIALFIQTLTLVEVRWRAVWWGAAFITVSFLIAVWGTSIYFRLSSASAAGIAASLFVVLLLANILSSVFLFGAEVTRSFELYLETGQAPGAPATAREPEPVIATAETPVAVSAIAGFLSGLFVGWWRRR